MEIWRLQTKTRGRADTVGFMNWMGKQFLQNTTPEKPLQRADVLQLPIQQQIQNVQSDFPKERCAHQYNERSAPQGSHTDKIE